MIPLAFIETGLCPKDQTEDNLMKQMTTDAWPNIERIDTSSEQPAHIFGDGSANPAAYPTFRLASFAIVLARPGSLVSTPIGGGCLDGPLQTIGRAEMAAAILALQSARHVVYYVDNKSVYLGIQKRILGVVTKEGQSNSDLWKIVDKLIMERGKEDIKVVKVKSHKIKTISDTNSEEYWMAWNNDRADELAKQYNCNRENALREQHKQAFHHWKEMKIMYKQTIKLHIEIAKAKLEQEGKNRCTLNTNANELLNDTSNRTQSILTIDYQQLREDVNFGKLIYGQIFTCRLYQWAQQLLWLTNQEEGQKPEYGISWVELMLDYCFSTNTRVPVNISKGLNSKKSVKRSNYQLPDLNRVAQLHRMTIASQAETFRQAVKHAQHVLHINFLLGKEQAFSKSLQILGHSGNAKGLSERPKLINGPFAVEFLQKWINCNNEKGGRGFGSAFSLSTPPKQFR